MSSSFRNFFISFILCLLIFGYIGYSYLWPAISNAVNFTDDPDTSDVESELSGDTASVGDVSGTGTVTPPHADGTEVTYMFMGEAADDSIGALLLVRVDEGAKTFTYCSVPASAGVINEVGVSVPISVYFADASIETARSRASAMMGFNIDYYMRVDSSFLNTLIATVRNPHFELSRSITCRNPKYEEIDVENGDTSSDVSVPDDYYIEFDAGNVNLNSQNLDVLLQFSVEFDNLSDLAITTDIYNALFVQYMTGSATKRNASVANSLIAKAKQTNITSESVESYNNIFFTYDEYKLTKISYTSWSSTVDAFRNAD